MTDGEVLVMNGQDRPVAVPAEIVLEAQREYRAYLAHQKGDPWAIVAQREGWPSAASAQAAVARYLREGEVLIENWTKSELLALEIQRLNVLQAAVWEGATQGKIPAVMAARQLILDRVKLQKLDEEADNNELRARTVVVYGDGQTYTEALMRVAED